MIRKTEQKTGKKKSIIRKWHPLHSQQVFSKLLTKQNKNKQLTSSTTKMPHKYWVKGIMIHDITVFLISCAKRAYERWEWQWQWLFLIDSASSDSCLHLLHFPLLIIKTYFTASGDNIFEYGSDSSYFFFQKFILYLV